MNPRWLALPSLLLLVGCPALDPAQAYRDAARRLAFSLDRVEPTLRVAFPLERSRVGFRLTLGVDNPSDLHLKARSLGGELLLEHGGQVQRVGNVAFTQGLDLPARGRASLPVELSFTYEELKGAWGPLQKVLRSPHGAVWRLEGQAGLDVLGIPVTVPLRARKTLD